MRDLVLIGGVGQQISDELVELAAPDRGWRIGWRMTEEAIEAFYRTGGRPTAAWHLLRDEGCSGAVHTAFCRALEALEPRGEQTSG